MLTKNKSKKLHKKLNKQCLFNAKHQLIMGVPSSAAKYIVKSFVSVLTFKHKSINCAYVYKKLTHAHDFVLIHVDVLKTQL